MCLLGVFSNIDLVFIFSRLIKLHFATTDLLFLDLILIEIFDTDYCLSVKLG